jgi:hypothetical protein
MSFQSRIPGMVLPLMLLRSCESCQTEWLLKISRHKSKARPGAVSLVIDGKAKIAKKEAKKYDFKGALAHFLGKT